MEVRAAVELPRRRRGSDLCAPQRSQKSTRLRPGHLSASRCTAEAKAQLRQPSGGSGADARSSARQAARLLTRAAARRLALPSAAAHLWQRGNGRRSRGSAWN